MDLGWYDVAEMAKKIGDWINEKLGDKVGKYTFLAVVRGGLIPGVILSHRFDGCSFQTIAVQRYNHQLDYEDTVVLAKEVFKNHYMQEPYIVVDDINDEGITLEAIETQLKGKNYYVTLVERTSSMFTCDFAGMRIDHNDWVNFPWGEEG